MGALTKENAPPFDDRNQNNKTLTLTFPMRPTPKERPRSGRHGFYTPRKTRNAEMEIQKRLFMYRKLYGDFKGPVEMTLEFHFAVKDKKKWGKPHTARPDWDNCAKLVLDSANGFLYRDDSQVFSCCAKKFYAAENLISATVLYHFDAKMLQSATLATK